MSCISRITIRFSCCQNRWGLTGEKMSTFYVHVKKPRKCYDNNNDE